MQELEEKSKVANLGVSKCQYCIYIVFEGNK